MIKKWTSYQPQEKLLVVLGWLTVGAMLSSLFFDI
ncbi:hypothetical protein JOC54_000700 [Alkalihalobacillus xiaoxiensis]|uniref:Uncharacterized protein n=1 Tax=Shouchella xiaoxiensis TaxID=766895 RepID=A0ABS2SPM3_9BACI|nr:hypothetical protein [Shouchella xiaoxiensis]